MLINKNLFFTVLVFLFAAGLYAQDDSGYGKIISISENTVTVVFDNKTLKVGDEVEFKRFKAIVDPVTKRVRGGNESVVARGVVDDAGLGKVYVNLVWKAPGIKNIELKDKASFTGVEKKYVRTEKVTAKIQNLISDKEIEIDAGQEQDISEGDMFLIQRTENVVDPNTKQVTGQNTFDIGKGKVNNVSGNISRAEVIELNPGLTLNLETDGVVFEPQNEKPIEKEAVTGKIETVDSASVTELRNEIGLLRADVDSLKSAVDSLRQEQNRFRLRFVSLENEINKIFKNLQSNDIKGLKVRLKNEDSPRADNQENVLAVYKTALDNCLMHKFGIAVPQFEEIIVNYPESPITENCRYWIALSNFTMGNMEQALEGFKGIIDDTRFTQKDDDSALMTGILYYKTGQYAEALAKFNEFVTLYPDSEYKEIVEGWIQKLS